MMQQYEDAKAACPGAVLFFRMGDFYELFHDDAKLVARVLNLALTSRDKGENPVPMAGFPHHQLDGYLGKMLAAGHRVAVCEQMDDPRQAKGIVKREVTRIVSPGTVTDDALLDPRESNFLAAIADGDPVGLAWIDLSTGRFAAAQVSPARIIDELARIGPVELLAAEESAVPPTPLNGRLLVTRRPAWAFGAKSATEALCKHFNTRSLEGFGFNDDDGPSIRAAGAILDYLVETQKSSLGHIDRLVPHRTATSLEIDEATRRSLEITRTMRDGRRDGTLLSVLDRTVTAMGSRRLCDWTNNPLVDLDAVNGRHDAVGELAANEGLTADLRDSLRQMYDVERLLARVTTNRATPRDLCFLGRTLRGLPAVKARLTARSSARLNELEAALDLCADLRAVLEGSLEEECPLVAKEGGFIRAGCEPRLDELRELAGGGKQWIARYQATEAERTGIPA
jgi:DNA mismatch repair protein MutS